MIGYIDVDFRPDRETVPRILGIINEQGYTLRGLRPVPCLGGERSTLKVDIGTCRATSEIQVLADQLLKLEGMISVIHGA